MTFSTVAVVKDIASITCTQSNLGHQVPCGYEGMVTILNCLLLSISLTNETLSYVCFLIMCDFLSLY